MTASHLCREASTWLYRIDVLLLALSLDEQNRDAIFHGILTRTRNADECLAIHSKFAMTRGTDKKFEKFFANR